MTASDTRLEHVLSSGPPSGAWLLLGDQLRLRDEAARRLAEAALDPATRDFNYDEFEARAVSPEDLSSAVAMPPMMAERRVVFVRDVQGLPPAARATMVDAAARCPADVVLIITATVPRNSKAKLYSDLRKHCETLEWNAPRASEVPGWILDRARQRWGFEVSREAAQALAAAVGADLSLVDAELEKLGGLGRTPITLETIHELVPRTRRIDRFTWLDLVAGRDYRRALRELDDVLTSQGGVGLVSGLVEHHLLLGLALEGGVPLVRKTLTETGRGYFAWKASTYGKQAAAWRAGELDRALRHFRRADRMLKSGGSERAVLADLLLALEAERERRP